MASQMTNKFYLRLETALCKWCWITTLSIRPDGRQFCRIQARPAAPPRGYQGEAGIEPSAGSVGESYDNALVETINGLHKVEFIHRRGPWKSFDGVEFATLEWVDWFNHRRLLEPIGNIAPAEAEARDHAALEHAALAA